MVQWETLAGFAAAAAAYWNVLKLARQIQQTQELAEDQRRRRARAARAILPLTLSEISEYATASIKGLYALKPCFLPDGSLDQAQAEDDPRK